MSEFILTPTYVNYLDTVFRNPVTNIWTIPTYTFSTLYPSPFYNEIDPLNDSISYQKSLIEHFYLRLKEKWLYKSEEFRDLLKYFIIEKKNNTGSIKLIDNLDDAKENPDNITYKNYIFKYIEKNFITRRFVGKILRQFVSRRKIKWYDLFNNTDSMKKMFAHKLKKLIKTIIYEMKK